MTISQAVEINASKNTVKRYTMLHVVDKSNIRFPNEFNTPATCEAVIFVHNGTVRVGTISNLSFDLVYNIKSWCDLELAIMEEATAVYLD